MRIQTFVLRTLGLAVAAMLLTSTPQAYAAQQSKLQNKLNLNSTASRNDRRMEALGEEVRHQLVMLPYYSVFDWLQAQVKPDGTVTLMGQVVRPTLKDDALNRVKSLESASHVVDNIEVLPLSPMDNQIRIAVYRAIFSYDSPLFRYATQSVPPVHIIVKNGHVTLKGIVASQSDSDLANIRANQVSGVFSVKNELQIEGSTDEKISRK
jgi:hyperosmotically inducible periplasmic protein